MMDRPEKYRSLESEIRELKGRVLLMPMNLMGLIYLKGICFGLGLEVDEVYMGQYVQLLYMIETGVDNDWFDCW